MRRLWAGLGSLLFFLLAPGFVAGLAPWWISRWLSLLRVAGATLIALGTPSLLDSFTRFALQGLGTPAPIFPTRHLVVTGLYRHVRNPMYVGVVSVIVGQGLLLGNVRLLGYGVLVWPAFYLFVVGYEEPTLRRTFGALLRTNCIVAKHVPFIPGELLGWK
jgi:protein-S-isoprenylcysteine O-methyltransferase Ste14